MRLANAGGLSEQLTARMSSMSQSRTGNWTAAERGTAAASAAATNALEETAELCAFWGVLGLWLRGLSTMLPAEGNRLGVNIRTRV